MKTRPKLGADIEFFIYNGKLVTADKILKPKRERITSTGYAFFDGVQAEINPDASFYIYHFVDNIRKCLIFVSVKYPNGLFSVSPSVSVDSSILEGCQEQCFNLQCNELNVYSGEKSVYPDGHTFMKRFAGGHVHIGYNGLKYQDLMTEYKVKVLVKVLDSVLGVMSVAFSHSKAEMERRKMYGRAGMYWLQIHGLEYRTLSAYWMASPVLSAIILGIARDCFTIALYDEGFLQNFNEKEVVGIINNNDCKKAKKIYQEITRPYFLKKSVDNIGLISDLVEHGYEAVFERKNILEYWL